MPQVSAPRRAPRSLVGRHATDPDVSHTTNEVVNFVLSAIWGFIAAWICIVLFILLVTVAVNAID